MREHETIHDIKASVIDSCIDVIIGQPVIRGSHLVHKIPSYFDEANRSNPLVRQSVVPVTQSDSIVPAWLKDTTTLYARCGTGA